MPPDERNNVVRPNEFQRPTTPDPEFGGGRGSGGPPDMNGDRLAGIEGRLTTIESEQRAHLRWAMLLAIGLASLFIVGFGIMMVRIDRTEDKISRLDDRLSRVETSVSELPGKIDQNLMQLTQTMLQAITATNNQRPPQVIVVPQSPGTPLPK
jgi:hypothetical protein